MKIAITDEVCGDISTMEMELTGTPEEQMFQANMNMLAENYDFTGELTACEQDEYDAFVEMYRKWVVTEKDGHIIGKGAFSDRNHQSTIVIGPDAERILTEIDPNLIGD